MGSIPFRTYFEPLVAVAVGLTADPTGGIFAIRATREKGADVVQFMQREWPSMKLLQGSSGKELAGAVNRGGLEIYLKLPSRLCFTLQHAEFVNDEVKEKLVKHFTMARTLAARGIVAAPGPWEGGDFKLTRERVSRNLQYLDSWLREVSQGSSYPPLLFENNWSPSYLGSSPRELANICRHSKEWNLTRIELGVCLDVAKAWANGYHFEEIASWGRGGSWLHEHVGLVHFNSPALHADLDSNQEVRRQIGLAGLVKVGGTDAETHRAAERLDGMRRVQQAWNDFDLVVEHTVDATEEMHILKQWVTQADALRAADISRV